MKLQLDRDLLLNRLTEVSRFTANRITTISALQGACLVGEKDTLHFYATNLSSYVHTTIRVSVPDGFKTIIEPKKIIEFLGLLPPSSKITLEFSDKDLFLSADKTKGSFPLISFQDFPFPPKTGQRLQTVKTDFLTKNLPLVTFAASGDESRAALTGVNFVTGDELVVVATDGFRLSLVRAKKDIAFPPVIIPSEFLLEVLRYIKGEKEVLFGFLEEDKMVVFSTGTTELYSRIIDGDFPAYEKVIPTQKTTTVIVAADDLVRVVKIASVFARDFSSIVVLSFKKSGLECRPKMDSPQENAAFAEIEIEGEEQKVAFNFKFLLDFLAQVDTKKITIEILRPDAPVVFRIDANPQFLHIIMPVRIQE